MFCDSRLRLRQQWRLLMPVTMFAVALSLCTSVVLHASDGDLDLTFGDAGKVTIDFLYDGDISTSDEAYAVAIQPDGKIVTAGAAPLNILIALPVGRTNPDGSPDLTFGSRGQVLSDWIRYQQASSVVIQPDGKIVIGGWGGGWPDNFLLVRYNSDGSLDTSFGDNGLVQTGFGDDPSDTQGARSEVAALAFQDDGKIVAAGTRTSFATNRRSFALARYNPDGSLDPTFGANGRVITTMGSNHAAVADVALQADGNIVVAGSSAHNFQLARYKSDGTLDTTFSGNGLVRTDFGAEDTAHAVAVQADGMIVAAGTTITAGGGTDFALVRYNADGTLDATFGAGGMVTADFGGADDEARDMALQADGKIVVAGSSSLDGEQTSDIAVSRYEVDGTLDPTFGAGGLVITDIAGSFDAAYAVAIQVDGKIVVAGSTWIEGGGQDFAIVRYESAPAAHPLTFFLRGRDLPGTTGVHTMTLTPPVPQLLSGRSGRQTWFTAPILNGTLLEGSTFEVTLPCTRGISLPKTVRVASTDPNGGDEQILGEAAVAFAICRSRTIPVPVATPIELAERRLKLTLFSEAGVDLPLWLGPRTFLRATRFASAREGDGFRPLARH